jgi:SSS family transporter
LWFFAKLLPKNITNNLQMSQLDWGVMLLTLLFVIGYGTYKGRADRNTEDYLLGGHSLNWFKICLSVMATQASAITFLSVPGQAYTDGMRFLQFYFGLPLAMIFISVVFIPVYSKYKLYTAYEYLEGRFDLKTRVLASLFFLIPRALSTGVTIAAPAIILASVLGWGLTYTTILTGLVVTIYCIIGGTKAVSYTQMQQMFVILVGMFLAGWLVLSLLPQQVSIGQSLSIAGKLGKMNAIDWKFDLDNRYNVWSGLIGGFFLQLSYFGTDQSQVGRYLTASSDRESKLGLLMNGFLKIPMQFFILLIGVLVFVYYQFNAAPLNFNSQLEQKVLHSPKKQAYQLLQAEQQLLSKQKQTLLLAPKVNYNSIQQIQKKEADLRQAAANLIKITDKSADTADVNYIFLNFVKNHLPHGLIGLLIAMILLASMGSMASAFNSLTSTTSIDIYKRTIAPNRSDRHYLRASRWFTLFWGLLCIVVALFAVKMGSLIEVVNILGSWFYGTVLGVFLVAFFMKQIDGNSVFWAAIVAELLVLGLYYIEFVSFLWLNVIGTLAVMVFADLFYFGRQLKV